MQIIWRHNLHAMDTWILFQQFITSFRWFARAENGLMSIDDFMMQDSKSTQHTMEYWIRSGSRFHVYFILHLLSARETTRNTNLRLLPTQTGCTKTLHEQTSAHYHDAYRWLSSDSSDSKALAMEWLQYCAKPSICAALCIKLCRLWIDDQNLLNKLFCTLKRVHQSIAVSYIKIYQKVIFEKRPHLVGSSCKSCHIVVLFIQNTTLAMGLSDETISHDKVKLC